MKKIIFTSNTKHYHKENGEKVPNEIDNTNGIVDLLKEIITSYKNILFIAADPSDYDKVNNYSKLIFEGMKCSNLNFENYLVLDDRTIDKAKEYVENADVIFLSGGDTYIENVFFNKIHLKELLQNYDGILIGQSAGSLNIANNVYNSPEDGIESEPIYFEGLGLSNINIEPHFELDDSEFDENEIYQRKHIIEESKKRDIYALCDGSHIYETDESITIYGKSYLIRNGEITLICEDKNNYIIEQNKSKTM